MDSVELKVLTWVLDLTRAHETLVKACGELEFIPKSVAGVKKLAKDDPKLHLYRHYVQCLKMRELARLEGSFTWWCAATFGLVNHWKGVTDSIPWAEWGPFTLVSSPPLQILVACVAGCGGLEKDFALKGLRAMAPEQADELLEKALKSKALSLSGSRIQLGPKAPIPR